MTVFYLHHQCQFAYHDVNPAAPSLRPPQLQINRVIVGVLLRVSLDVRVTRFLSSASKAVLLLLNVSQQKSKC